MKIAICVGCVCTKLERHHKFPLICPKLNYPCLAIRPDIMDNPENREQIIRNNINGIEYNDYSLLDRVYIKRMKKTAKELLLKHINIPFQEADE